MIHVCSEKNYEGINSSLRVSCILPFSSMVSFFLQSIYCHFKFIHTAFRFFKYMYNSCGAINNPQVITINQCRYHFISAIHYLLLNDPGNLKMLNVQLEGGRHILFTSICLAELVKLRCDGLSTAKIEIKYVKTGLMPNTILTCYCTVAQMCVCLSLIRVERRN